MTGQRFGFKKIKLSKFEDYNLFGQKVLKKQPTTNSVTIETNGLQSGIYIAKSIMIDGKESISKFIKI